MHSVEWLAGLLEGEGCFTTNTPGRTGTRTPLIGLGMTDGDVITDVQTMLTSLGGREVRRMTRQLPSGKTVYTLNLTGLPAVKVMCAILPYMGERRGAKIRAIIAQWDPRLYAEARAFKASLP